MKVPVDFANDQCRQIVGAHDGYRRCLLVADCVEKLERWRAQDCGVGRSRRGMYGKKGSGACGGDSRRHGGEELPAALLGCRQRFALSSIEETVARSQQERFLLL
jgi:hypothetical protein